MTRLTILITLIGVITVSICFSSAHENPASGTPLPYTIRAVNDTVWLAFGDAKLPVLLSTVTSPDTSHLTWEHDLILFAGRDTLTIRPTIEPASVRMISDTDTVLAVFIFIKEESDAAKVTLLRRYSTYDRMEPPREISFTYRSGADSNLARLRTTYNLDAVAGPGDEISRIMNLMHWVHAHLPHDGIVNLPNPDPFTSANILAVAEREKRPFHCGILATVLNDVYLSMGFKSRRLGCLPFDKQDGDSHSVVMVWSDDLDRWLLMDPTFDAYFTGAAGAPLGPAEIREAMANGDSIAVADCINWNGQPRSKIEHYNYMAKNLFRLLCGARWSAGGNAKSRSVYVYLLPLGYDANLVGTVDSTSSEGPIQYYTSNADWFFVKPK
jgi:hypothetical protein